MAQYYDLRNSNNIVLHIVTMPSWCIKNYTNFTIIIWERYERIARLAARQRTVAARVPIVSDFCIVQRRGSRIIQINNNGNKRRGNFGSECVRCKREKTLKKGQLNGNKCNISLPPSAPHA